MQLENFDKLTIEDKILLIEDMGDFVYSLEFYDHRVFLFSFQSAFVEVYKNLETDQVEKVCSVSIPDLDKYLSRITLGNLLRKTYIL
jgi:hypothetical protein